MAYVYVMISIAFIKLAPFIRPENFIDLYFRSIMTFSNNFLEHFSVIHTWKCCRQAYSKEQGLQFCGAN